MHTLDNAASSTSCKGACKVLHMYLVQGAGDPNPNVVCVPACVTVGRTSSHLNGSLKKPANNGVD